jgi:FtsP/CotA-like multicopper oxidase with cupredoxin domain
MNAQQLIAVDLVLAAVSTAAWLAAAAILASGRPRPAAALTAAAVLTTLGRVVVVVLLAGHGWWFVQDKLTVALPLVGVASLAAVVITATRGVSKAVVPLYATGFASTSGLIFQFLFGYPMTLAQAVATVTLAGAATAIAWQVVSPTAPKRAAVSGAAALVLGLATATALGSVPGQAVDGGGPVPGKHHHAVSVTGLRGPSVPAAGGSVRRYAMSARQTEVSLGSGQKVAAWSFDGKVPGPAITATEGDLVEVTLTNVDIESGVTIHWHGYDVRNGEDGVPGVTQDAVPPGGQFVYRFLASQVGTYWYHTHQVSDRGVRMGLYGTLIVSARQAQQPAAVDIVVPVHTFDGMLAIGTHDGMASKPVPTGTTARLRLINTDSEPHRFTLAGAAFRVVAADGNDLSGPAEVTGLALRLAAGGRYDITFTMPSAPVALRVDDGPVGLAFSGGETPDGSTWPELDLTAYGTPADSPSDLTGRPDREFTMVLDRGLSVVNGKPAYAHTINGRAFPSVPTQVVREGDLVVFTVVNRGRDTHPWHLHGHRVLVLAKDGRPVSGSPLLLDTFDVRPGEVWRIAFRASNPGVWMNHCHNLSHAEQGMSMHLAYEGVTTPFHGGHGS